MVSPEQQPTIAILGTNTIAEHALSHLLEEEGYTARLITAPPRGSIAALPESDSIGGLLEGVSAVLVWPPPTLSIEARDAFLAAMREDPATRRIPTLALSRALKIALQDELAAPVPLKRHFDYLDRILKVVLASPEGSVDFLDLSEIVESGRESPEPAPRTPSSPRESRGRGAAGRRSPRGSGAEEPAEIGGEIPHLPPGYRLDLSDPDVPTLLGEGNAVIARFSARGATPEEIEREAWRAYRSQIRPA